VRFQRYGLPMYRWQTPKRYRFKDAIKLNAGDRSLNRDSWLEWESYLGTHLAGSSARRQAQRPTCTGRALRAVPQSRQQCSIMRAMLCLFTDVVGAVAPRSRLYGITSSPAVT